jgi:outer membrane protein assembly factor BamB
VFDVTTGQQLFKLTANDAAVRDQFGHGVGISGNIAIVGAPSQFQNKPGAVYLFDVTTGQQLRKLRASDASTNDGFGYRVAIDGNIAIVDAGYLFDVTTGQELFKLVPSDSPAGFGTSVDISGNTAIVSGGNAVYLFDVTTGQQLLKLTAPKPASIERFGGSVSIDGNRAIVGAAFISNTGPGAAYVFDVTRIPGDFNTDGNVDAADYVVWRNGIGTTYAQTDYDTWRANFGRSAAGAAAVADTPSTHRPTSIPEPVSAALVIFAVLPLVAARRKK